jgi:serine/threonine-protein phosphatase 2B catalytic subunit
VPTAARAAALEKFLPRSYTLPAGSIALSESMLKELERKGMGEAVAYHRGNTSERVVKSVAYPETARLSPGMLFDDQAAGAPLPSLPLLRQHLLKEGRLTSDAAKILLRRTRELCAKEPNLLDIAAPVTVCGDLHGQFYDLVTIFEIAGLPPGTRYLFLGDYVDRGFFSCEIVLYLCAMKMRSPDAVFMLRGNHESRLMCEYMTFLEEVLHKYDAEVYEEFQRLFDALPIAAVVRGTANGDCLCVHGGIGPGLRRLADINAIDRFCEIPKKTVFWDLVWSDPTPEWESEECTAASLEEWERVDFALNTNRHSSYQYGLAAVQAFLKANKLCCIVRGHQVQQDGYFEHFARATVKFPIAPVLTIFSAPNYCDQYGNRAAFLQILPDRFMVQQFTDVAHPHYLPGFTDVFSWSLPMLLENVVGVLQQLVVGMIEEGQQQPDALPEEEQKRDHALAMKTKSLYAKFKRVREQQEEFMHMREESYHKNMSLFERMCRRDRENEACPVGPAPITKRWTSGRW